MADVFTNLLPLSEAETNRQTEPRSIAEMELRLTKTKQNFTCYGPGATFTLSATGKVIFVFQVS